MKLLAFDQHSIRTSVISVRVFRYRYSSCFPNFFRSVTVIVNEKFDFSVTVTVIRFFRYIFVIVHGIFSLFFAIIIVSFSCALPLSSLITVVSKIRSLLVYFSLVAV